MLLVQIAQYKPGGSARVVRIKKDADERSAASDELQGSAEAFGELYGGRDQASDHVSLTRKVVEVAGMQQNSCIAQQRNGKLLIRTKHGDAKYCVPSTLDRQPLTEALRGQLGVEFGQVRANPLHELEAEYCAAPPTSLGEPIGREHSLTGRCR